MFISHRPRKASADDGGHIPTLLILSLFAASGCVSLIYEVVWRRMLSLMVGGTVWATAMVLAAFMGGLALGAAVFGSRADRWNNPLAAYGWIEGMIGLCGLVFFLAAPALRALYATIAAATPGSLAASNLIKAPVVLIVLLPPTFLMGATFPVLASHYLLARRSVGRGIGELYLVNTAGAVCGALLAGFLLIRIAGVRGTNLIAISASLIIGACALVVSRKDQGVAKAGQKVIAGKSNTHTFLERSGAIGFALTASGFAALSYEVLWTRILVYLVGNSTYSFAVMLSAFLLGIAIGAALFRAIEKSLSHWAATWSVQIAIGFVSLLLLPLSNHLYDISRWLFNVAGPQPGYGFLMFRRYVLTMLVLLPTTILLGLSFPILARFYVGSTVSLGKRVGSAYALNTLGAVVGSLAAVFVLLPLLGIGGAIIATACVNMAAAIVLLLAQGGVGFGRRIVGSATVAVLFIGVAFGAGYRVDTGKWMDGESAKRGELLFYREGVSSTVAVFRAPDAREEVLMIDGISQVPTDLDSLQVFKLLGHLPFLVRPETQSVLVTAFGGGITAGAILTHPVERVDVVEICPGVLEASRLFLDKNRNALSHPRLKVFLADANEFVRWTPRRYDAIISDSTHPGAAESWVLYTQDFYRACQGRLNEGGVMCQWLPLHRLDTEDFRTILRTFQSVFPHTTLWFARGYTVLLATEQPLQLDLPRLRTLLEGNPTIAADLKSVNLDGPASILKNLMLDERAVAALASEGRIATENSSPLEFSGHRVYGSKSSPQNQMAIRQVLPPKLDGILIAAATDEDASVAVRIRADYLDGVRAFKSAAPLEALASFQRAAMVLPHDRDILIYLRWAAEENAKQYLAAGRLEARETELRQLASQLPQSAILQMAWGLSIIAQASKSDRPDDAKPGIDLLRRAVEMAPDDPYVLDIVGQACLEMRAYPVAAPLLENLSRIQPNNPAVLCNLARAYAGLGRAEQARQAVERALRIDPKHAGARALLREVKSPPAPRTTEP